MIDKTILIVEDEEQLHEVIKKKLEISGFSVVIATSIEEALLRMNDTEVDAVWLDHYFLGKEDGLDFVEKMKSEDSKWKKVPIFVVSNSTSPEKVQTYLQLGINKYYTKANHKIGDIVSDIVATLE